MNLTEKIGEGSQSDVYLYRGYAYKLFHSEKQKAEAFYEAFVNTSIERTGLPAAKVYEVFSYCHKPVIKMDYIAGCDLNKLIISNPINLEIYMKIVVSLQIQVHSQKNILPFQVKKRIQRCICETDKLTTEQKNRLLVILMGLPDGDSLCHGDFHGGNILCKNNQYFIIDWADAAVGHKFMDVCRTYMLYSFYSVHMAEIYLRLYCEYTDSRREEILKWLPVVAAARLSEEHSWEFERIYSWIE